MAIDYGGVSGAPIRRVDYMAMPQSKTRSADWVRLANTAERVRNDSDSRESPTTTTGWCSWWGLPAVAGRRALRVLADAEKVPVLNVGAEISRQLLDLTERQRILQLPKLLEDAVAGLPCYLTILDNAEVLFNPVLKQDPLRLLQGLSRDRTIVASWLGDVDSGHLTCAVPEHPEFRRNPSSDLLLVCLRHGDEPAKVQR